MSPRALPEGHTLQDIKENVFKWSVCETSAVLQVMSDNNAYNNVYHFDKNNLNFLEEI